MAPGVGRGLTTVHPGGELVSADCWERSSVGVLTNRDADRVGVETGALCVSTAELARQALNSRPANMIVNSAAFFIMLGY